MTALLTLLMAVQTAASAVTGLAVVPEEDRTSVVISVDGAVTWNDFAVGGPPRIVIDVRGATERLPQDRYTGINRGGVAGLRLGQFQPGTIRIVIDLEQAVTYRVNVGPGEIRVSFANPGPAFVAWNSGTSNLAAVATPAAAQLVSDARAPAARSPEPTITISFQNTPIADVLATFAEFSGRSIVMGSDITATVTADIREQPWDVALRTILESHGLDLSESATGIIRVQKRDRMRELETQEELETQQFPIRYVAADSLLMVVQGLITERGKVTVNRGTNALVITEGRTVLARIAPRIAELDALTPQVNIAAKIIFVDRTALEELGFTYDLKDSRGNQLNTLVSGRADLDNDGIPEDVDENVVLLGGSSIAALGNATQQVPNATLQVVSSLVLGRHSLITFITALESMSMTDIQARPSVTVLDHRQARIVVGEETPLRIIDAGAGGGEGGGLQLPRATVQIQETGIILEVTPHVSGNQVLLDLHAERSSPAFGVGDAGVAFQKQASDTQVLVENGATAVIAGLTVTERTSVRTGIPFLMDLPVVGALFRNTRERESKRDLLIMVTPTILRGEP